MPNVGNALIENVSLTMEDHGVFTFYLTLKMAGSSCCYGGFCIGNGYLDAKKFSASARGLEVLMRIMDTVGVSRWEDLSGKYIRFVNPGLGGTIKKIGNIIEDKWFDIEEFLTEKTERRAVDAGP